MTLLIGDIGGTNARFALANKECVSFNNELTLQCSDFPNVADAINHYLESTQSETPEIICLAVAGPVVKQTVQFTNNPWSFSAPYLQNKFSSRKAHLLNDFEAIAYSIPSLKPNHQLSIGQPVQMNLNQDYTLGVVGPGTGLGAVGLRKNLGSINALITEAGHTGFAPRTPLQTQLLQSLEKQYGRISNERLISGPGLANIYAALSDIYGTDNSKPLLAADIFSKHLSSDNDIASKAIAIFYKLLGQFAGDFALSIGAFDGLYLAGGVAQRYPDILVESNFRNGFEDKGRHQNIMKEISTTLITHPEPGLLGASHVARELHQMDAS